MQSETFYETLTKWQTSYNLLIYAVDAFRDACENLLQTVPQTCTSYVEKVWLEEAFTHLRGDADRLGWVEGEITESRALIRRTTNISAALVPINGLPSEILSHVFTLTAMPLACAEKFNRKLGRHPLVAIPAVCIQWRQLAINTRSLWSRIYMDEDFVSNEANVKVHRRIQLWLERSDGAPLSLRFYKEYPARRIDAAQIASLLQPHIANVASLMFYKSSDVLVQTVLTLYGIYFPSTPLTTLCIDTVSTSIAAPSFIWPVAALRGLSTLALSRLPALLGPSLDDLAHILLHNPQLHTLRIQQNISVLSRDNARPKASLPNLKTLELDCKNHVGLEQILSILDPSTKELDLVLTLPTSIDLKCVQEIQAFFERANVTRLDLKNIRPDYVAQLPTYFDSLSRLQALCLGCASGGHCATLGALMMAGDDGQVYARCPNLHSLDISTMVLGLDVQVQLRQIVETYRLNEIVYGYGVVSQPGSRGNSGGEDILGWLRQRVKVVTRNRE